MAVMLSSKASHSPDHAINLSRWLVHDPHTLLDGIGSWLGWRWLDYDWATWADCCYVDVIEILIMLCPPPNCCHFCHQVTCVPVYLTRCRMMTLSTNHSGLPSNVKPVSLGKHKRRQGWESRQRLIKTKKKWNMMQRYLLQTNKYDIYFMLL